MTRLFDPNLVYPSDSEGGRYIELDGAVVELVHVLPNGERMLRVSTPKGIFTGFSRFPGTYEPQIGDLATIRIYDAGGGHYPDNRITSLRRTPTNHKE